jgi:predicted  nucleic acid-binding Zn-ribbon protein
VFVQLEINDLQRQKYEWQSQAEEAESEARELMAPTVRQYQSELLVLHEELAEARAKVAKGRQVSFRRCRSTLPVT